MEKMINKYKFLAIIVVVFLTLGIITNSLVAKPNKPKKQKYDIYVDCNWSHPKKESDGRGNFPYTSIQQAVDVANNGDAIYVFDGGYYENVIVDKTISLTGEDRDTTILDGMGNDGFAVFEDFVNISGFTIINCTNYNRHAIIVWNTNDNKFINNNIIDNRNGINLQSECNNNQVYHNNFFNNEAHQAVDYSENNNQWDDGYPSGGNYWDDYTGVDGDGDGIGDAPYTIPGYFIIQDLYPLMNPK